MPRRRRLPRGRRHGPVERLLLERLAVRPVHRPLRHLRRREQLHRELEDIVERAEFDERAEWGRAVRSGDRLLVEVEATPMTGAARRLTATVVVSVARPDTEWASETAGEIAAILRDAEISIASDRLAQAFDEGWSRKTPFDWLRLTRVLAAAGAALTIAWWWMRSAGRVRKRRRAKVPTSGEQE